MSQAVLFFDADATNQDNYQSFISEGMKNYRGDVSARIQVKVTPLDNLEKSISELNLSALKQLPESDTD